MLSTSLLYSILCITVFTPSKGDTVVFLFQIIDIGYCRVRDWRNANVGFNPFNR